jgi:hypothetical protein
MGKFVAGFAAGVVITGVMDYVIYVVLTVCR